MAAQVRAFDWSTTPTGPLARWPRSLRTAVEIALSSRYPMFVWWGRELINIYNDAYAPMLGKRHPAALGQPAPQVWHEIWDLIAPLTAAVLDEERSTWNDDLLLVLERNGYPEEAYFTFSYSPLWDAGSPVGLFGVVIENTQRVLGERRLRTLRELAADTSAEARTADAACRSAAASLAGNPYDLPFVLIYRLEDDSRAARLAAATGLADGSAAGPPCVELEGEASSSAPTWPFRQVLATGRPVEMSDLGATFGPLVAGSWPEPVHTAMVLPIHWQERVVGFVVAGISPRRPLDDGYRDFCGLLAGHVATAIANAEAHEAERRRTEALAEIDRAKTAFFNNISHELRTPLTLMLAPLEEVVEAPAAADRDLLRVVLRNGLRLQKLVNSLLDFSRIEAGRIHACYEPTDFVALTSELASTFRSACERAGLRLVVDCEPLHAPVWVDRDMWEKVVLNLLSNAFKFTLAGEIEVAVRTAGGQVETTVRDTGIGIPSEAIAHLFERFYRVEGAAGRTQEGSGIGLALVRELVRLHGGEVTAESRLGQGSVFTVRLPFGKEHLDSECVSAGAALASTALGAAPFVEEALRWLPDPPTIVLAASTAGTPPTTIVAEARRPRVLVADDNADMRLYLVHLLGGRFEVTTVADGEAALAVVRTATPDLLLADVMMPRRDGFSLLRALRGDEQTCTLPVILLSARAGEEARVEGLMAGADDYVVKPFGARELLARVTGALALAAVRREALHHEREQRLAVEALRHAETERLELLASEREARAAAEHANRVKDDLLATVSHELRTPMNTVLLWVEAIRQHQLAPATVERGLATIERAVKTQVTLIEDLLDLSRIAAGKLVLADEPLALDTVVQLAIELVAPVAQEKGVTLRSRFAGGPWPMRGDAPRLQQVAWNLLANAVKFTPRGGSVEVGLERRDGQLTLSVHDSGQGIDAELLPHVFERFRQGEGAPSRTQGGLGIGLAIVRRLVELHGGSVRAASPGLDQGATFVVTLPAAPEASAQGSYGASAMEAASLAGVRVLLVEDDQDTRELVARILVERKAVVATAASVDAALEGLASLSPDVLISDISMPEKDGYSLIRELRRSPLHRDLPAVALTAFARPGDRTRALEAGFDRHVTKPVDMGELCATVASLLRERDAVRPPS
jgi:signal transduction histidine kinase